MRRDGDVIEGVETGEREGVRGDVVDCLFCQLV